MTVDADRASSARMLRTMILIRRTEERILKEYRQTNIMGAIHLSIGQEAVPTGVCSALRDDDCIYSTHRGHGHALAKGCDLKRLMAELMGRETGLCRGHGGSMHLYQKEIGLMGGNGIVGGGIPLALGPAFAAQYRSTDQVSASFFSDGASNQGTFHESLNLAALWKLPVLFVCENNCYAATTPVATSCASQDVGKRGIGIRHTGQGYRRQRCAGGQSRRGGRGGTGALRRRADSAGVQDLSHRAALRHYTGSEAAWGAGEMAQERPYRSVEAEDAERPNPYQD